MTDYTYLVQLVGVGVGVGAGVTDYTTYLVQLVGVGVGGGSRGDRLHLPCPAGRGRGEPG